MSPRPLWIALTASALAGAFLLPASPRAWGSSWEAVALVLAAWVWLAPAPGDAGRLSHVVGTLLAGAPALLVAAALGGIPADRTILFVGALAGWGLLRSSLPVGGAWGAIPLAWFGVPVWGAWVAHGAQSGEAPAWICASPAGGVWAEGVFPLLTPWLVLSIGWAIARARPRPAGGVAVGAAVLLAVGLAAAEEPVWTDGWPEGVAVPVWAPSGARGTVGERGRIDVASQGVARLPNLSGWLRGEGEEAGMALGVPAIATGSWIVGCGPGISPALIPARLGGRLAVPVRLAVPPTALDDEGGWLDGVDLLVWDRGVQALPPGGGIASWCARGGEAVLFGCAGVADDGLPHSSVPGGARIGLGCVRRISASAHEASFASGGSLPEGVIAAGRGVPFRAVLGGAMRGGAAPYDGWPLAARRRWGWILAAHLSALWGAVLCGRRRTVARRAAWVVLILGPAAVAVASPPSGSRVSESACYVGRVGESALRGLRTASVRSLDGLAVSLDLPGDGWTPAGKEDAASGCAWEIGADRTRIAWRPVAAGGVLSLSCEPHESFPEGDGVVLEKEERPWLLVERGDVRLREVWRVDGSGVRRLVRARNGVWAVPKGAAPGDAAGAQRAWRAIAPWMGLAEARAGLGGDGFVAVGASRGAPVCGGMREDVGAIYLLRDPE